MGLLRFPGAADALDAALAAETGGRSGNRRVRARCLAALAVSALAASGARAQGKKKTEPPPGWQTKPFSLENPSAGFKIALKGYIQADFRSFQDWTAGDEDTGNLRADEFEWRRARIGVEGEWKRLSFEATVDPAFDKGDDAEGHVGQPAARQGVSRCVAGTSRCR